MKYVLPRQQVSKNAPLGAFLFSTPQFTRHQKIASDQDGGVTSGLNQQ